MTDEPLTVPSIVQTLGGRNAVARLFACRPQAVSNWCSTGRFPAHTYMTIRDRMAPTPVPDSLFVMTKPSCDLPQVVSAHA